VLVSLEDPGKACPTAQRPRRPRSPPSPRGCARIRGSGVGACATGARVCMVGYVDWHSRWSAASGTAYIHAALRDAARRRGCRVVRAADDGQKER